MARSGNQPPATGITAGLPGAYTFRPVSSHPRRVEPRRIGSPLGDTELVDAHSFLHRRVTLYAQLLSFFFIAFAGIGAVKAVALPFELLGWLGYGAVGIFVAVAIGVVGAFMHLRRRRPSVIVLHGFESSGTVAAGIAIGAVTHLLPPGVVQVGIFLTVILMLVVRAAIVPSTARRTVAVGLACSIAIGGISAYRSATDGLPGADLPTMMEPESFERFAAEFMWLIMGAWGVIFTIATAIVSRVIYRLTDTARLALQLGNYILDRKLGEGGMGVVYLAHHALIARPAALKLLRHEKAGEEAVKRFAREVEKTSELVHPNTVRIFDFGHTPDGTFYYVMEYLPGLNLRELVDRYGRLPPGRLIYILAQVAHALDEAHRGGLVHRDIKPANIVLSDLGGAADMAKLVDFGLARDIDPGANLDLSADGKISGTPMYMAPESIRSSDIDGRADLYALGAVGYFLLTGTDLFPPTTLVEVCGHHLHTTPERPSERIDAPVARDLEEVLLRCLAKDPRDRYPDALAFRRALLDCEDGPRWTLDEARRWWDLNEDDVSEFVSQKQTRLGSDVSATVTVALGQSGQSDEASPNS